MRGVPWWAAARRLLKVSRARVVSVSDFRTQRLLILERNVAFRTNSLRLWLPWAARQLDIVDDAVTAQMGGDGKIVDGADLGGVFHFLR